MTLQELLDETHDNYANYQLFFKPQETGYLRPIEGVAFRIELLCDESRRRQDQSRRVRTDDQPVAAIVLLGFPLESQNDDGE